MPIIIYYLSHSNRQEVHFARIPEFILFCKQKGIPFLTGCGSQWQLLWFPGIVPVVRQTPALSSQVFDSLDE